MSKRGRDKSANLLVWTLFTRSDVLQFPFSLSPSCPSGSFGRLTGLLGCWPTADASPFVQLSAIFSHPSNVSFCSLSLPLTRNDEKEKRNTFLFNQIMLLFCPIRFRSVWFIEMSIVYQRPFRVGPLHGWVRSLSDFQINRGNRDWPIISPDLPFFFFPKR